MPEVELCQVARLVLAARPVVSAVDATLPLREIALGPVASGPTLKDLLIRVIDGFVSVCGADVTSGWERSPTRQKVRPTAPLC